MRQCTRCGGLCGGGYTNKSGVYRKCKYGLKNTSEKIMDAISLNGCKWEVRATDGTWHERSESDALLVLLRFGSSMIRVSAREQGNSEGE